MRPIEYIDYDKLSDDVYYLGSKLYLRMNVSLSDKVDPDIRYHFHKEYKYFDPHAPNKYFVSIKRKFSYFLSLDRIDIPQGGIMIRPQDMIVLKNKLEEISKWFSGNNIFGVKNKKLIIKNHKEPIIVDGLANQKYIQFDPIVVVWENTNEQTPGVRITLGDPSVFADISVDKFFGFLYTISTFNMYQSAQLLLNYLGRPEFGYNMRELENYDRLPEDEDVPIKAVDGRQVKNIKNLSFFQKMDMLNNEED